MQESKAEEIIIGEEENEEQFKEFIKFLYTGSIDCSDQTRLVEFIIVSNKYLVRNMKEFKVSPKVLLNGIIAYVDKDVDARIGEFDNLCENVNFKKFDKEELLKIYTKKKWLQKTPIFLSTIIMKDVSDDDDSDEKSDDDDEDSDKSSKDSESESSDKDSDKDSDKSSSDKSSSDEGEEDSIPKYLPKLSSTNFKFSKKNRSLVFNGSSWNGTVLASKTKQYTVKSLACMYGYVMLGYAPSSINKTGSNYTSCGYYVYLANGSLYSQSGDSNRNYSSTPYSSNSLIGVSWDKKKGQ